ncbi:16089_t:CDS:10 [Acaulospora colombiana]|uniref:16089_t:CDS:1 n=1 Tax=Acaulospora colombiana TaxID=27376 RepID=A0ACA9LZK4_9GLOM|nr:16089_t:CDS:10 [Acaulospora colombiana]
MASLDNYMIQTPADEWSLLGFLMYRKEQKDFSRLKDKEHFRYQRSLMAVLSCDEITIVEKVMAQRCLDNFKNEINGEYVCRFWRIIILEKQEISNEEEVLDEFQPPSKRLREDKLEQPHTPEDKTEKHSYRIDYLIGPGVSEWHLNEDSTRWVVGSIDISEICLKYRAVVVKKCESKAVILDAIEELLIACERLSHKERQAAASRCLRVFETATEEEEIMVEIFRGLVDNEQSLFMGNKIVEDTHVIQNVNSIIRPFFKNSRKITFEGANKIAESSAIAKRRFDPVLLGRKPDFTVITANPKKHVELLIGKVRPQKTRDALVSEDLVSLGKMMKRALDKSIKDGVDDLVICGLQVIGFIGRAYVMDLRFEGVYRMIFIGEFELPRGSASWSTVLRCYRVMNTIRVIVNDMATLYQPAIRMNIKQTKSEKIKLTKPMFHSPMEVPI